MSLTLPPPTSCCLWLKVTLVPAYTKRLIKGQPFGLSLTESMVVQSVNAGSQGATQGVLPNSRLCRRPNRIPSYRRNLRMLQLEWMF